MRVISLNICLYYTFTIFSMVLVAPRLVLAGPPFLTDDPVPVEYQHHEFYIATQQTRTNDGTTGTLPHLEFNYGAAPNIQLHILIPYAFSNPTIGSNERGLGDIELGIKYRFAQETKNRPMMAIFPLLLTPTGSSSKGLGAGGYQLFLPLWLEKNWNGWQTNGGGGYWYSHIPNTKNHWFFGWQLQKDISEHLTLGGEVFYSTEQVPGQGASSGFNLGGYYNFDEYNHLLFSAGKGLTNVNATNKFSSYLAYQWTW